MPLWAGVACLRYRIYLPQSRTVRHAIVLAVAIVFAALASYLILALHG